MNKDQCNKVTPHLGKGKAIPVTGRGGHRVVRC
jgi:hypothetical protein